MGDQGHEFFLYGAIIVVSGVLVLIVVAGLIWLATGAGRRKKSRRARHRARSASYPTPSGRLPAPAPTPVASPPPLAPSTATPLSRGASGNGKRQSARTLDETDYDLDLGMRATPREKSGLDETDYDLAGDLSDTGGLSDSKFETAVGLSDSSLVPDADSSTMMGSSIVDTGLSDSGILSPHTTTRDFSPRKRRASRSNSDRPKKSSSSKKPGPHVPADGPGSYRVTGVDKKTGLDTELILYAQSRANAKIKGQLKGIVVAKIERIGD